MFIYNDKIRGQIYKETIVIESIITYFGNDYKIEHKIKHGVNDEKQTSDSIFKNEGKIRGPYSQYQSYYSNFDKYLIDGEIKFDDTETGPAYEAAQRLLVFYDLPTLCKILNDGRDIFIKNTCFKLI